MKEQYLVFKLGKYINLLYITTFADKNMENECIQINHISKNMVKKNIITFNYIYICENKVLYFEDLNAHNV